MHQVEQKNIITHGIFKKEQFGGFKIQETSDFKPFLRINLFSFGKYLVLNGWANINLYSVHFIYGFPF